MMSTQLSELKNSIDQKRHIAIGIGPMSKNCVDIVVELANQYKLPLMFVASRRQIEAKEFGSGYVNSWSTEEFAKYVRSIDVGNHILLARDHGGPWQNTFEVEQKLSPEKAMETAKRSYEVDIESGFDIIHIDPSVDIFAEPTIDTILNRVFELYEFCYNKAQELGRDIAFEIGTEEQTLMSASMETFSKAVTRVEEFCASKNIPKPMFVVAQTGSKVLETTNVGYFDKRNNAIQRESVEEQVKEAIDICREHGVYLKAHNVDYLSDWALARYRELGVHACNIAPEFGVAETRRLLELLKENKMTAQFDRFIEVSLASGKWKKWMIPNGQAQDLDRAIIAGHYVFNHPEVIAIKKIASDKLSEKGIDLDGELRTAIRESVVRYLQEFGHFEGLEVEVQDSKHKTSNSVDTDLGGNQVREFGLKPWLELPEEAVFSKKSYQYSSYLLSENQSLNLTELRSCTIFVKEMEEGTKLVLNNDVELSQKSVVQAEGQDIQLKCLSGRVQMLIAGTEEVSDSSPALRVQTLEEVKRVSKPWGHELWLNGEHSNYAFKEIFIKQGTRTSLQYHRMKKETNVLVDGEAALHFKTADHIGNDDVSDEHLDKKPLQAMSSIDVSPNTLHRLEALTDVLLYEVSTPHLNDVIRVQDDRNRKDGRIENEHA